MILFEPDGSEIMKLPLLPAPSLLHDSTRVLMTILFSNLKLIFPILLIINLINYYRSIPATYRLSAKIVLLLPLF